MQMEPPKVLIIEDNLDNLTLVQLLLERESFQIIAAYDGQSGLKIAKGEKPDLVVLDLDMPVLDGWEVIHTMKADPALAQLPIVVVTAHLLPGERNRVLSLGCDGYVSKPYKVQELLGEIRRVLSARSQSDK